MPSEVYDVIVTGVGGQGNVLASQIIATAAVESGFYVSVGETFGASQRGGSVMSHIRMSKQEAYGPLIPRGKASLILGFEPLETLRTFITYGGKQCKVIMNLRPNYPLGVLLNEDKYPDMETLQQAIKDHCQQLWALKATELAVDAGVPVGTNMVMTGAFAGSGLLPIQIENFAAVINGLFTGDILKSNLAAFRAGVQSVS